ncbi:hypothetical protein BC351_27895 [Paenibacillus ferrarius]|uniref:Photosynthesis system II assembly factor Ycf48/Hcf136-like domain-containing protein n=1 Tax=Paenibacillus ferrarius TaxID=1469647 RepID=A0A1V4HIA0_9BACL|nr:hypothetical protein [Paenibacillus ferrarius]OPH56331.1 hypothetical protein BC351_27895 [Paenibacillus ferrarius]
MIIQYRMFTMISLIGCMLLAGCDSNETKVAVQSSAQPTLQTIPTLPPSSTVVASAAPTSLPDPVIPSSQPTPAATAVPSPAALASPAQPSESQQPATPKASSTKPPAASPKPQPIPVRLFPASILTMDRQEGLGMQDGKLLYTKNTGKTWEVKIPDGMQIKDRLLAADFLSPFLGFAYYLTDAKQPKLVATQWLQDSSGLPAHWKTAVLPTEEAWETSTNISVYSNLSLTYPDPSYALLTSSPAAGLMGKSLYRTDDQGTSWQRVSDISSAINGYPTGIAFPHSNDGWITATYHGPDKFPLFRTQDGGKTWAVQHVEIPDEFKNGYANTFSPVFDQEGDQHGLFIAQFALGDSRTYVPYETHDGGNTWLPLKYQLTDVQESPIYQFDNMIEGRAISTDGKSIYTMRTYNKEDWQQIVPNIILKDAKQFFLNMDGFGWVLLNGHLKITMDGGRTWSAP